MKTLLLFPLIFLVACEGRFTMEQSKNIQLACLENGGAIRTHQDADGVYRIVCNAGKTK